MDQVMIKPPIKKPITAIKEGSCKFESPDMACPEVHPPAYREPNPTSPPPSSNKNHTLGSDSADRENSSSGFNCPLKVKPRSLRSVMVAADRLSASGLLKNLADSHPPIIAPSRKSRFHRCAFQSKLKKLLRLPAPAMLQMVRKLAEKPKLFPQKISISIITTMTIPEKYQGQGCLINSIISMRRKFIFFGKAYSVLCRPWLEERLPRPL